MTNSSPCDLTTGYSFVLQSVLGVLAFSTLVLKRYREPKIERRPFGIWVADTAKQALGMLQMHFVNLAFSELLKNQQCISYLVNFLLDSTVGLLIIYTLLSVISCVVNWRNVVPLRSGEYGTPFKPTYWLAQCGVYLVVMLAEKLVVGPLVVLPFWKIVSDAILPKNAKVRTVIVIFIVPFTVNVFMFWIVDSILMHKKKKQLSNLSVHYHPLPKDKYTIEDSDSNSQHSSAGSDVEVERRRP